MKKLIYLLLLFSIVYISSCGNKECKNGDCIGYCNELTLNIKYTDSLGNNLVGDSINQTDFIKYNKDSIKYFVSSIYDTTPVLSPIIFGNVNIYTISIKYLFSNLGEYNVTILLNSIDKDTISINTNDARKDNINISHNNVIIENLGYDCTKNITIIK